MTIKELSEYLDLPQSKLKKLCSEILGCIPAELSTEDENKIRQVILQTTQALAASEDNLVVSNHHLTEQQEIVREILGERTLKLLIRDYLSSLKTELDKQKLELDKLTFQSEQAFYNHLSSYQQNIQDESIQRIRKTSQYYSPEGIKFLTSNSYDDELLTEIAELMMTFSEDVG